MMEIEGVEMKIPAPTTSSEVPAFFLGTVRGFKDHAEFHRLDGPSRAVPGLVVGQLTVFLRRLEAK